MVGRCARGLARLAVAAGLAAGLMGATVGTSQFGVESVTIKGFAFSPGTVTIAAGQDVEWANEDATNHTATADDGTWDTQTIAAGETTSLTFDTPGTYPYHCAIHSSMHGTLVVEAPAASQPPTDTVQVSERPDTTRPTAVLLGMAAAAILGLELGRRRFRADGRRG